MLRKYAEDYDPTEMIMVWDAGRDARRLALYPDYKKRKSLTEEELADKRLMFSQMDTLRKLVQLLGVDQYAVKGREADDVIFSLVERRGSEFDEIIVISTDKDFFQLLEYTGNVKIFSPIKEILYDRQLVEKEYNIPIEYFSMYKSLVGDHSDNLPGVKGMGPKRSVEYIDLIQNTEIEHYDSKQIKLLERVKTEDLDLMTELIEFISIPEDEVAVGKILGYKELVGDEGVLSICMQLGFKHITDNFDHFIRPFEMLIARIKENA
jgi:DNA polymerase-1